MKYFLVYLFSVFIVLFLLPITFLVFVIKMDLAPAVVFGLIGGALFIHIMEIAGLSWSKVREKRNRKK